MIHHRLSPRAATRAISPRHALLTAFVIAASLAACADQEPPTAPPGAILGRFGGSGAAVVATATETRLEWICGVVRFPNPIVPDLLGYFGVGPILLRDRSGRSYAMSLSGSVSGVNGDVLEVRQRALRSAGEPWSLRYTLTRDQPTNYNNWVCGQD